MGNFRNKKILVLGLGLNQGGVGVVKFLSKLGAKIRVTDLRTKAELQNSLDQLAKFSQIEYSLGGHKNEDIDWADIIVRNPSVKPNNKYLKYAVQKNKEIVTDLSLFLGYVDQTKIIAVTGTKGKSTTTSLIYNVLKDSGKQVLLAGNIGKSVLEVIPYINAKTFIVLELSSFQLDNLEEERFAPYISVITNIFPDHLNYHKTMEEYINAKRKIAVFQEEGDYLFLRNNDPVTHKVSFLENLKSKVIYYDSKNLPPTLRPHLKGTHNLENIAVAFEVVKILGINVAQALISLEKFEGVEFRMQLIKEVSGTKIYNDSTATNPTATIQTLKTFPNCLLIVGGMDKGLAYEELNSAIIKYAKSVFLIKGTATDKIHKSLIINHKSLIQGMYSDLLSLLEDVKGKIQPGDIVLFSPGATSFNLFLNEFDRGRKFNEAVEKVFAKK